MILAPPGSVIEAATFEFSTEGCKLIAVRRFEIGF
jgi:hypothetical protein